MQVSHAGVLPLKIEAAAYVVESNQVTLWQSDEHKALPPASLTKIMTALLVLEHYAPESLVTISREAANETGTRLPLKAGSQIKAKDLLAATVVQSANDSCHALAELVSANQAKFVTLMNQRAKEWHLTDTHFSNACGHDDPQHFSSAHDLAILANKAIANPAFLKLASTREMTIATVDGKQRFKLQNSNALLGRYEGATGLKTGYTPKAGKCLIAYATRNGVNILLVLLNAPNRWWDASDTLDYAFQHATH
ncbi:MAG: D-alanyl-D-alanine carboxypeptidase family protein [Methylophilaceae bacterium]|nr:D-alanyl-D-alanine carboxypeptidase family protein [Methyloradius sp.]